MLRRMPRLLLLALAARVRAAPAARAAAAAAAVPAPVPAALPAVPAAHVSSATAAAAAAAASSSTADTAAAAAAAAITTSSSFFASSTTAMSITSGAGSAANSERAATYVSAESDQAAAQRVHALAVRDAAVSAMTPGEETANAAAASRAHLLAEGAASTSTSAASANVLTAVGVSILMAPGRGAHAPEYTNAIENPNALPGRQLAFCEKKDSSDSSIEQCQDWCRYPNQCEYCKCRSCSMCKPCTSEHTGDTPFESCEAWCSMHEHCSHCKCRGCSICQSCTPADEHDVDYQDCQTWCSGVAHCNQCKCKGCPVCKSQCTPYNHDDDDFMSCQSWCHTEAYHCPYCKCKACPICADRCMSWCSSESDCASKGCQGCPMCEQSASVAAGRCEPWCQKANCRKPNCAGCKFCEDLGEAIPCTSEMRNDAEFEECASWCNEGYSSAHCKFCSCRRCMFCAPLASGPTTVRETNVACPPADSSDSATMRCESFCKAAHLDIHCDMCKCKACDFCPARTDSGIACTPTRVDDSSTVRCEPFCAMAHAEAHCAMCKCSGCSFCHVATAANHSSSTLPRLQAQRPPPMAVATAPPLVLSPPPVLLRRQLPFRHLLCPWLDEVSLEPSHATSTKALLRLSLNTWPDRGGMLVVGAGVEGASDGKPRVWLRYDAAYASVGGAAGIRSDVEIAPSGMWLAPLSDEQVRAVMLEAAHRLASKETKLGDGAPAPIDSSTYEVENSDEGDGDEELELLRTAFTGVALYSPTTAATNSVSLGASHRLAPPNLLLVGSKEPLDGTIAIACIDGFEAVADTHDISSPEVPREPATAFSSLKGSQGIVSSSSLPAHVSLPLEVSPSTTRLDGPSGGDRLNEKPRLASLRLGGSASVEGESEQSVYQSSWNVGPVVLVLLVAMAVLWSTIGSQTVQVYRRGHRGQRVPTEEIEGDGDDWNVKRADWADGESDVSLDGGELMGRRDDEQVPKLSRGTGEERMRGCEERGQSHPSCCTQNQQAGHQPTANASLSNKGRTSRPIRLPRDLD